MNEPCMPFLRGYNIFRLPIIDENGVPAWPSVFPTEKIEELRNIVGPRHFSSQMMLEYIAEDKARLDPGALHFYNGEFDARTAKLGTDKEFLITGASCYWDPSGGLSNADASVCVLLYRDDKNHLAFIHDVRYLIVDDDNLHPLATQCESVLNFNFPNTVDKLKREQAEQIYKTDYWDNLRFDEIKNDRIRDSLFDIQVMSGYSNMVKQTQEALNNFGIPLNIDKVMGNQTIGALNTISNNKIHDFMEVLKENRIRHLENDDPQKWQENKTGWTSRTMKY